MRMRIDTEWPLLKEAMAATGLTSEKEVIEKALCIQIEFAKLENERLERLATRTELK